MPEPTFTAATAVGAIVSGVGAAVGVSLVDQAAVAFFGVKAIVVLFAFIGAAAALAYSESINPRARMVFLVLVNTMVGIVASLILEHIPFFGWTKTIPGQGIAFVAAFLALWAMPVVVKRIPYIMEDRLKKPLGGGPDKEVL